MKKNVIYQVRNVIYKTCTPELVHNVRVDSSREHPPRANMVYKRTQHVVSNMLAQHVAFVWTGLKGKTSVIKLSVSIFGQTAVCRIYTVSREPIRLPEIQWYLITLVKVLATCCVRLYTMLGYVACCWHMLRPV